MTSLYNAHTRSPQIIEPAGCGFVSSLTKAKYEPYYAFGLTVTLIWLYLEILRLMRKTWSRK